MSGTDRQIVNRKSSIVNRRAFTLIELLVVISIIALLMAVLVPALQRIRKQAKNLICQTHLRTWGTTLALYTQDSGGRLPCDIGGTCGVWLLRGAFIRENEPNAPQDTLFGFPTQEIACCPFASKPLRTGIFGAGSSWGSETASLEGSPGEVFGAWEITRPAPAFHGSYGFNGWLFSWFSERPPSPRGALPRSLDTFSLRNHSRIPLLLDATFMWDNPRNFDRPMRMEIHAGGSGIGRYCINRHEGGVNALFLDWSVRKVGLKELWTLPWSQDFDTAGKWTQAGGVQPGDWPEWMRGFKDY